MAKKKRPRRKPNPAHAVEAFLAEVPEAVYAELPDDVIDVVDAAAEGILQSFPQVKPRAFRRMVRRRVVRHYRAKTVGWEFDQEKCEAFMELLIKYLPLILAL